MHFILLMQLLLLSEDCASSVVPPTQSDVCAPEELNCTQAVNNSGMVWISECMSQCMQSHVSQILAVFCLLVL